MLATLMGSIFWGAAVFFSILFLWQLLATLFGHIGGGETTDVSAGHDVGAGGHDVAAGHDAAAGHAHDGAVGAAESVASFKLLSIRSITAFGMLFGWAGVLYSRSLAPDESANWVIIKSLLWGFVGMLIVSAIFYFLMRMTESGTRRLSTCVGQRAMVYMDIPAGGTGQVKTIVSGIVTFVPARAVGGEPFKAGTPVIVKRLLDATTVEVEKAEQ